MPKLIQKLFNVRPRKAAERLETKCRILRISSSTSGPPQLSKRCHCSNTSTIHGPFSMRAAVRALSSATCWVVPCSSGTTMRQLNEYACIRQTQGGYVQSRSRDTTCIGRAPVDKIAFAWRPNLFFQHSIFEHSRKLSPWPKSGDTA